MRIFTILALILCITSTNVMAAPITKNMAEKYYNSCINKQSEQKLTKESQEYLCACTASKMMDNMTTEDIQAMNNRDETARAALNFMIVKVYAPCMEYPAKDHYYNTCITNPKTKSLGKNPEKLCGCMSDKVAQYLGSNGEAIFKDILSRNPNVNDPMAALEGDKKFQDYVGKQVLGCVF